MLDLYTSIHRQLLKNLTLAGIVVCLLTGITVAFVEFRRVDSYVADIAIKESQKLAVHNALIRSLIKGAFLHDVGKIGISDSILLKPGQLTAEEFEIMKTHVLIGADIILDISWLQDALDVISFHHERYDGTGYLSGLKENNIPQVARIFAIADVFDALLSHRPYKEPFTFAKAMSILREGSGTHFDPTFLEVFEQIAPTLYADIYAEENEERQSEQLDLVLKKYFTLDL